MNEVLVSEIEKFIALNPEMVDAVMQDYGISKQVPLNVKTVVDAFKVHGESFAKDLYNALRPSIERKLSALSNVVGEIDATTQTSTQASGGWDWGSFFSGLSGLAGSAPAIITAANGNPVYPNVNMPGYYPPPTTSTINILMYVAIAVAIIVVMIVVFKKA